jgi:hypothetical protein
MPLVFSYGTLQLENVQLSTFGRRLSGERDELLGYEQTMMRIDDPEVVAISGKDHHPAARFTGNPADRVSGTVFDITDEELESADRYEVATYTRVSGHLASGKVAWVYVDARHAPKE